MNCKEEISSKHCY